MNIKEKIKMLYEKDSNETYKNLLELEALSEKENSLYQYFNEFLKIIENEKYSIRVRGYRLLCKQAKWDVDNKINNIIDKLLSEVEDEKPTAVRQKIKALQDIIVVKKELSDKVKKRLLEINVFKYKDTMQSLIQKDIKETIELINDN